MCIANRNAQYIFDNSTVVMPCVASAIVAQMCAIYIWIIICDSVLRKRHLRKITAVSALCMLQSAGQIFTKYCCLSSRGGRAKKIVGGGLNGSEGKTRIRVEGRVLLGGRIFAKAVISFRRIITRNLD